jgi:2-methylisocitrate lyase-like PEP mutase family enzyme
VKADLLGIRIRTVVKPLKEIAQSSFGVPACSVSGLGSLTATALLVAANIWDPLPRAAAFTYVTPRLSSARSREVLGERRRYPCRARRTQVESYEDHEGAPADEMLAAAARIARGVEVPVTVDAEAGYGMEPAELVTALRSAGAAGCNLEDTDHAAGSLHDPDRRAEWLTAVRRAASADGYGLVINARVDVFLGPWLAGTGPGTQEELVPEALQRANAYLEAGADCVYPIALWETDALRRFISEVRGPVNVTRLPQTPSLAELAALGVARVSWGTLLYRDAMARFADQLASLQE